MTPEVVLSIAKEGEIEYHLVRYRDERGDDWADIIDTLTMYPDARRKVARFLRRLTSPTKVRRAGQASERRGTRPLFASPRDDARPALDTRLRLRVQIGRTGQAGESEGDPSRRST